jgi:uncharacterized SAM-binding protein YcdF (DUF218 family)
VLHTLSKLTSFIWDPGSWVILFVLLAVLLLRSRVELRKRLGRRSAILAVLLFIGFSWVAPANYLISQLELEHSPPASMVGFDGVIILGGAIVSPRTRDTYLPPLASAAERVVEPVALLAKYPQMRALFLGGDARITDQPAPEADAAKIHFERLGVDMSRMRFESLSRNTYENAMRGRDLAGIDANAKWLLVTSAWHMPRALATFQKSGWNVSAYPVDYFAPASIQWFDFNTAAGFAAWELFIRESAGLLIYRGLGRA